MVLVTIHGAKGKTFLMGWAYKVREYLGVKPIAVIEVLAFPFWPDSSKQWVKKKKKTFAVFLSNIDNSITI